MGEGLPPEPWTRKKKLGHETDHLLDDWPLYLCTWGAGSSCAVLPQTLSTVHQTWASARARAKAGHDHLIVAVAYHLLAVPCATPGITCEDDREDFLLHDGQVPRSAVPLYLEPRLAVPCSCPLCA